MAFLFILIKNSINTIFFFFFTASTYVHILMKKLFLLLVVAVSTTVATAQIVNIPDPLFKQHLLNQTNPIINTNGDDEIQVSEAEAALIIRFIADSEFTDLTGLEAFVNLEEISGQRFAFTFIDLSVHNNLEIIFFPLGSLEDVVLPSSGVNLKEINLSENSLQFIQFPNSYSNLENLNIGGNENISSIDVSSFSSLTSLEIYNTPISQIDLQGNGLLQSLHIGGSNISNLDFSQIPNLENLYITNSSITTLDISSLTLRSLGIGEVIQNINLDSQPQLEELLVTGSGMPSLDITALIGLKSLQLYHFPHQTIDLSGNNGLEYFFAYETEEGLIDLDLSDHAMLTEINLHLPSLETLDLTNCVMLEKATMTAMKSLQSANFSGNSSLIELELSGIQYIGQPNTEMESLDLSQNNSLEYASIDSFSGMNSLIVEGASSLESLHLNNLSLPSVNLNNNTNLRSLFVRGMNLDLDISTLSNLDYVTLRDLPALNITYPTENNIKAMTFSGTGYSSLDFSGFSDLCWLRLSNNLYLEDVNMSNIDLSSMASSGTCITDPLYIYGTFGSDLRVNNNPNLRFICVDDAPFAASNFNDTVDGYVTFTEDCSLSGGNLNTIAGALSFDLDGNSCATGASAIPNRLVLTDGDGFTFGTATDETGNYKMNLGEGSFTTYAPNFSNIYNVNPENAVNTFVGYGQTETEDFCVEAAQSVNDLNIAITANNQPTPGRSAFYSLIYENAGTTPQNIEVSMTYDNSKMNFIEASVPPTSQTSNTLIWDLGLFNPLLIGDIEILFNLFDEPINQTGDSLSFTATIEPISGDATPGDNTFVFGDTVENEPFSPIVNGSQPNQKLIDEADEYLYFSVGFENFTSQSVENAVVYFATDSSSNIDFETVQVMASGNPVETLYANDTFYFYMNDINLPPTLSSGMGEQGNISFRFKPVSDIEAGDVVRFIPNVSLDGFLNSGFISVQYVTELGIEENIQPINEIVLYPNPTSGIFTISATQNIQEISIFSITGQSLKSIPADQASKVSINIEDFAAGVYFVRVVSAEGEKVFRVLKR